MQFFLENNNRLNRKRKKKKLPEYSKIIYVEKLKEFHPFTLTKLILPGVLLLVYSDAENKSLIKKSTKLLQLFSSFKFSF